MGIAHKIVGFYNSQLPVQARAGLFRWYWWCIARSFRTDQHFDVDRYWRSACTSLGAMVVNTGT